MRCVIIAGSPDCDIDFISETVQEDDFVICADLGYVYARRAGVAPDLIVGDFDSCTEKILPDCETITLSVHKDDTDTMHCIDVALKRGCSEIVILCALGGRTDHTFANISALQYISEMGGRGVLLSKAERVEFLPCGEYSYRGLMGVTFSLFPFGCESTCVSYRGAEYPLEKYRIKSSVPLGISNTFISDEAKIKVYDGNAIVMINLSENNKQI